jgi:hypothetical protein
MFVIYNMFIYSFVSHGNALVGTNKNKVVKLPTCFSRRDGPWWRADR